MLPRIASLMFAVWALINVGMAQERLVIRGGTVVNVRDGSLMPDTVVVVEGDRIASIFRSGGSVPQGGRIIDATGKYLLPGLIDPHVHLRDWSMELYLNHGVTTVINTGSPHEWIKAQKELSEKGLVFWPRIFHSTYAFLGPLHTDDLFVRPFEQLLKDPEEALSAMRIAIEGKVDLVKAYDYLSADVLRVIVREAKKANIPVTGDFSAGVSLAAEVGANGILHMDAVDNELMDKKVQEEAVKKVRKGYQPPNAAFMDFSRAAAIIQLMIKSGIFLCPTLRSGWQGASALRDKGFPYEDFDLFLNNWDLRYVPLQFKLANLKEYQEAGLWNWKDLTPYEQELFDQGYANDERFIKMFVEAGGKLLTGTGSASLTPPGIAIHQEMELLVKAGVSPLKVLQGATIAAAEFLRKQDRLGTLEEGKVGDVLILDANPLENIRNTRKIHKVISKGRLVDGKYHADFKNPMGYTEWEHSTHYFPSPRIRWASPEAIVERTSGATLTVQGSGFIPYSLIVFNGQKLKTNYVNALQLTAEVPANLLQPGTYSITIENPDFAWGTTNARGAGDLEHLGIRGPISNEFLVLVKPKGGSPIFPHPREKETR